MKINYLETKNLDYEEVTKIFFEVGFLKHPKKRSVYKKAIEKAFRNSQYVVSAWDKDKLVGLARVLTDGSIYATIWNMMVRPEYQKKGIGTKLINRCLNKYPKLYFFLVADKNVASFYKNIGFKLHSWGMYLEKRKKVCVIYN